LVFETDIRSALPRQRIRCFVRGDLIPPRLPTRLFKVFVGDFRGIVSDSSGSPFDGQWVGPAAESDKYQSTALKQLLGEVKLVKDGTFLPQKFNPPSPQP
jgi:hypothetical protein